MPCQIHKSNYETKFREDKWEGHVVDFHRAHDSGFAIFCSRFDTYFFGSLGSVDNLEHFLAYLCWNSFYFSCVAYSTAVDSLFQQVARVVKKIMKLKYAIFAMILSCIDSHAEQLIFPLLPIESQSNIIVTADFDHPKLCLPEYTNLISNTNLFSIAEQNKLNEVTLKYQNVTTNSGPAGSVFKGWGLRRTKYPALGVPTNVFWVACFTYTNSDAQEEIRSDAVGYIKVRFRTPTGDGYDVSFVKNALITYQEYKHGMLDGLFVALGLIAPSNPKYEEHCGAWARFVNGKILGKFIMWGPNNLVGKQVGFQIVAEAEFKEPFDFLKYQSIPIDLAWTEVPN
jgi:hypothetical protein